MSHSLAQGKVYFVGAGVGDPEDLTLKAQRLITQADVIIYDALVAPSLLHLAPENCLKLEAGKRGGRKSTPQEQINQLLIAYATQGYRVVRLKSGDPTLFGRLNEEMNALRKAHFAFEIVPGLSSAFIAPLSAEIPLTDKYLSQSVTLLTGHNLDRYDGNALAKMETLIILMGTRTLPQLIDKLHQSGQSLETPIAIIKNAGFPEQKIWMGRLKTILNKTKNISLSPSVIVIGEVVKLSPLFAQISLSDSVPLMTTDSPTFSLSQQKILVTRAVEQSSKFSQLLTAEGATVTEMPSLAITPPSSWAILDQAIENLEAVDWLILTSANGVNFFCQRLFKLGYDLRVLGHLKIAVVGRKTAKVLENYHLQADFIPPNFVADSLVETFPEILTGKTVLFPRVETGGRAVLVEELTEQGATVIEAPTYESACPETIDLRAWEALVKQQLDFITFASSKTVKNFNQLIEKALQDSTLNPDGLTKDSLLKSFCIASIGPQTSRTCQEILGRVDLEAEEYTLEGLIATLKKYTAHA